MRWLLSIALLLVAPGARAAMAVLDYDAGKLGDFKTVPYVENGITTTVDRGHYELYSDATGEDGDKAFNMDERSFGLSKVTLTAQGGGTFDVLSLDVINPADSPGEYTISAIGGGGGSMPAPMVAGPVEFGPGFAGISALVVTQNAPGSFTFDDLTVNVLPEPSPAAALAASALALAALGRLSSRPGPVRPRRAPSSALRCRA
jgi:hypothetical protein